MIFLVAWSWVMNYLVLRYAYWNPTLCLLSSYSLPLFASCKSSHLSQFCSCSFHTAVSAIWNSLPDWHSHLTHLTFSSSTLKHAFFQHFQYFLAANYGACDSLYECLCSYLLWLLLAAVASLASRVLWRKFPTMLWTSSTAVCRRLFVV